jgi:hypothetical protein
MTSSLHTLEARDEAVEEMLSRHARTVLEKTGADLVVVAVLASAGEETEGHYASMRSDRRGQDWEDATDGLVELAEAARSQDPSVERFYHTAATVGPFAEALLGFAFEVVAVFARGFSVGGGEIRTAVLRSPGSTITWPDAALALEDIADAILRQDTTPVSPTATKEGTPR